ncbi:unnamed protein product [Candida dubliniensis CD36]|uniref:Uncharacterized protein n=1 Tax=Candida dubliniensis (strain CD36 / ATCC MYA-646 / CBS 7987 / NCPF 3949 / NRRL Y-17841) TaxID=573826 RepID=B9WFU9_CANDC|nr:uncharacterized protein CD36_42390 [Candida dubliniensis CD36]CAX42118.1 unnamed protein product [Candida dubliniensis CD36]
MACLIGKFNRDKECYYHRCHKYLIIYLIDEDCMDLNINMLWVVSSPRDLLPGLVLVRRFTPPPKKNRGHACVVVGIKWTRKRCWLLDVTLSVSFFSDSRHEICNRHFRPSIKCGVKEYKKKSTRKK